jgi:hypothetical protein
MVVSAVLRHFLALVNFNTSISDYIKNHKHMFYIYKLCGLRSNNE